MKYFAVTCRCGHVGNGNFIPFTFAVAADSILEAQKKAVSIPRVKHDSALAIINSKEISFEDFTMLQKKNALDPYLKAKNKKDMKNENITSRIVRVTKKEKNSTRPRPDILAQSKKQKKLIACEFEDEFNNLNNLQFINHNFYNCLSF